MAGQVWGNDQVSIRKTAQLSQPDFARGNGTVDEQDSRRIDSSRDVEPRVWKLSHELDFYLLRAKSRISKRTPFGVISGGKNKIKLLQPRHAFLILPANMNATFEEVAVILWFQVSKALPFRGVHIALDHQMSASRLIRPSGYLDFLQRIGRLLIWQHGRPRS
jgi:hypothetical protein